MVMQQVKVLACLCSWPTLSVIVVWLLISCALFIRHPTDMIESSIILHFFLVGLLLCIKCLLSIIWAR